MLTKITDDLYIDLSKIDYIEFHRDVEKIEVYANDFEKYFCFDVATGKKLMTEFDKFLGIN